MSDITITLTAAEAETLKLVLRGTRQSKTVRSMLESLKTVTPASPVRCCHCQQTWDAVTVTDAEVTEHLVKVEHYSYDDASDNAQNTAWSLVHDGTLCTKLAAHSH